QRSMTTFTLACSASWLIAVSRLAFSRVISVVWSRAFLTFSAGLSLALSSLTGVPGAAQAGAVAQASSAAAAKAVQRCGGVGMVTTPGFAGRGRGLGVNESSS